MVVENKDIPVVILAGGLGSRLGTYTEKLPKPLIKIKDTPLIEYVISMWEKCGFEKFIVAGGYKVEKLVEHFSTSIRSNVEVVDTGYKTQTGGRIKRLEKYLPDRFMLSYGDGICSAPLQNLRVSDSIVNMLVVHPRTRFGEVEFDLNNFVINFSEKPISDKWVNGGMFGFSSQILEYIHSDEDILETNVFTRLIQDRGIKVQTWDGWWRCVDTPKDIQVLIDEGIDDKL
jgi:glucose-1-phosphate cytidylyltransferase